MDKARAGGEVVVAEHDPPVVRVGPAAFSLASPVGFMRDTIVRHGNLMAPDEERWAASTTDLLQARGK